LGTEKKKVTWQRRKGSQVLVSSAGLAVLTARSIENTAAESFSPWLISSVHGRNLVPALTLKK
jgi:hypothetical protein